MYKGGPGYTSKAAEVIRYAGLFTPIALTGYGALVALQVIYSPNFVSTEWLVAISATWIVLSVVQFLSHSKKRSESAIRLVAYHVLAGAYLLTITGILTPFLICWLLLIVAANIYFSRQGVWLSVISFAVIVALDITVWHAADLRVALFDSIAMISVLFVSLIVVSISRAQETDQLELRRSKAQESLQHDRILTIVNNLADAILSTDEYGVVRVYNAASLNLLDTNDSLNGRHIDTILPLYDENDSPVDLFTLLENTKTVTTRDDLRYKLDPSEELRLEVTFSPIRNSYHKGINTEKRDGYIIIMRDITKAKSLEEERDEFISVVSHELRTPITIAEGTLANLQIMLDRDMKRDTMEAAVETAHEQIVYLAKMVNDLSTLSRAERGIADSQEIIPIQELVHTMYDSYTGQAHDKGLQFDLDASAHLDSILASRLYVEELLQNLITNAIKYTKAGKITLRVQQKKETVTFSVQDTGIGISKSDQTKIFGKFYRSEDYRTRETGGTGLGLYVSVKLANKLGTEVKLDSRLNHGSTFSFSLPIIIK